MTILVIQCQPLPQSERLWSVVGSWNIGTLYLFIATTKTNYAGNMELCNMCLMVSCDEWPVGGVSLRSSARNFLGSMTLHCLGQRRVSSCKARIATTQTGQTSGWESRRFEVRLDCTVQMFSESPMRLGVIAMDLVS